MNSQYSKNIIRDLANLHGITEEQIVDMVKSQFRKLKLTMEECDLENNVTPVIRLPKFGLFFIKQSKLNKYGLNEKTDKSTN